MFVVEVQIMREKMKGKQVGVFLSEKHFYFLKEKALRVSKERNAPCSVTGVIRGYIDADMVSQESELNHG